PPTLAPAAKAAAGEGPLLKYDSPLLARLCFSRPGEGAGVRRSSWRSFEPRRATTRLSVRLVQGNQRPDSRAIFFGRRAGNLKRICAVGRREFAALSRAAVSTAEEF